MSDENHGPTLQEVYRTISDLYGNGWLAGKDAGCRCVCHQYPDHGRLQDALEALRWYQERERAAWEAGFELCIGYGDNYAHFHGEQKERQWKAFLAANSSERSRATNAVDPSAQPSGTPSPRD